MDALINEICRRVQQKLEELEAPAEDGRPAILILTQDHGTICHDLLENSELAACYRTECALLKEYQCSSSDYEAVIACGMSCEALGKIAHGILDSGYTRLFGESMLAGKKIYLVEEEIELFRYRDTAPKAYYACMEANLQLLKDSGVTIASQGQIPDLILHGGEPECSEAPGAGPSGSAEAPEADECCGKEAVLDKKVITEKDMIALGNDRVKKVTVGEKAILTDLAKEYASKHRIIISRGVSSSGKGRGL